MNDSAALLPSGLRDTLPPEAEQESAVTEKLLAASDAIVTFKEYPHVDPVERAQELDAKSRAPKNRVSQKANKKSYVKSLPAFWPKKSLWKTRPV